MTVDSVAVFEVANNQKVMMLLASPLHVWHSVVVVVVVDDDDGSIATPTVCLSVCLSVCHGTAAVAVAVATVVEGVQKAAIAAVPTIQRGTAVAVAVGKKWCSWYSAWMLLLFIKQISWHNALLLLLLL